MDMAAAAAVAAPSFSSSSSHNAWFRSDLRPILSSRRPSSPSNLPTCRVQFQKSLQVSLVYGIGASSKPGHIHATFCRKIWPPELARACSGSGQGDSDKEDSVEEEMTSVVKNEGSSNTNDDDANTMSEDDWRAFRARLIAGEQFGDAILNSDGQSDDVSQKVLSKRWAHPIPFPETGCLLVATEKLDGQPPFERSVVLLLRLGSTQPQGGPFGVILNRPILHTTRGSGPVTERMAQMLENCRLYYGGPLAADIFLVTRTAEGFSHLEEILPGVYYGYAHGLQQAAELTAQDAMLQDFRFFVGYAGWDFNQLKDEIAEGLWWVAACSPDLIKEIQTDYLWHEVLISMGGDYAEIGKRSKGNGM